MSLDMNKAPKPAGKDYGIAKAGVQMARLVSIVEIGEQPRSFKGQEKSPAVQLNFTFELPKDRIEIEDDDGKSVSKPRWVSINNVNFFTDDKARLVEIVKALDPNGEADGQLANLVGRPCFVTLEHKEYEGKAYAKIASISGVPEGMEVPELENEPRVFDWDTPTQAAWDALPEWTREKITTALNYKGSRVELLLNKGEDELADVADAPAKDEDFDDDIPF